MIDEKWQKVREIFDAALHRQPAERRQFVFEACAGDHTLFSEVESLLASLDSADSFLEKPVVAGVVKVIKKKEKRLEKGESLGHYQILEQIGVGGMGEVYLARDQKLDRQVAIKILNENFAQHKSNLQRFIQEAKAASALNHPNILTIHEISEENEAHFIVSEFIKGKTLREVLREKSLTLSEVLEIAGQIANALVAAHEARLVHRDIKPENIMIRPDGFVKVLDFGLAKLVRRRNKSILGLNELTNEQNQTGQGVILGTVNYMSPEQAKGEEVDERTDIFSLGAVIYEMLTGNVPFAGETVAETFANLLHAEPPPLAHLANDVPAELERVVWKMLRKEKSERYQNIKDLRIDLQNLKNGKSSITAVKQTLEDNSVNQTDNSETVKTDETFSNSETSAFSNKNFKAASAARSGKYSWMAVALAFVGVVALGLWLAGNNFLNTNAPILSAPLATEKLSTSGKVHHAVISPDGQKVIYTNGSSGEKPSIRLRQLDGGNDVEIIPPSVHFYGGLALSPDGDTLYFARTPMGTSGFSLFRVSIFGGVPQKITGDTQGWISVSPDGERISFVRCPYRDDEYCSLWTADAADGRNERKLASRPNPIRIADNQFSPDGRRIVFANGQSRNAANEFGLTEINLENGSERALTTEKFFNIGSLEFLPDGNDLLITAGRIPNKLSGVWHIAASGEAVQLTKDPNNYGGLSLDKSANRLISTTVREDFQLRLLNLEKLTFSPKFLPNASSLTFAPDGKIFFASGMTGNNNVWSINPDGSGLSQLTNDQGDDASPVVSSDGNSVFFASNRTGAAHIWLMNPDGGNQRQITDKNGGFPLFASSDGRWIYYHHSISRTLWRAEVEGGTEQIIFNQRKQRFAGSPDGSQVIFYEEKNGETILTIASLPDAKIIKTICLARKDARLFDVFWMPDGKRLMYILTDNQTGNNTLWIQPTNGAIVKQPLIDLGGEEIVENFGLSLSPDGKTAALAQGGWRHDMVLFKGLK